MHTRPFLLRKMYSLFSAISPFPEVNLITLAATSANLSPMCTGRIAMNLLHDLQGTEGLEGWKYK